MRLLFGVIGGFIGWRNRDLRQDDIESGVFSRGALDGDVAAVGFHSPLDDGEAKPCAALDPLSTLRVEQLITELKEDYTIVIVTHNMNQATRVSDRTAFLYMGELVEYDETMKIFQDPGDERTRAYISGLFS